MSMTVRFFAYFRDVFGGKDVRVAADDAATVGALLDRLGDTPNGGPNCSSERR